MKTTPFHHIHQRLSARLVEFGGYEMPVLYKDITTEHHAVRQKAGLFDLSHMGRVRFKGPDALKLATIVQSQDAAGIMPGRTRYALLLAPDGGILDDILISREEDGFLLVINAGNRATDLAFFHEHAARLNVSVIDDSERISMVAVQGPKAVEILARFGLKGHDEIKYYRFATLPSVVGPILVSRTGYTGEDGFELLVDSRRADDVWSGLTAAGEPSGLIPCGLGCRDTLRLEAGMPLYGHEIDRNTNPYEAHLTFGVSETAPSLGASALAEIRKNGAKRTLIGLTSDGPRIPRQGCAVHSRGKAVGAICSGTRSPTLSKNIATAMIEASADVADGALTIDIRGDHVRATRIPMPFYTRPKRS